MYELLYNVIQYNWFVRLSFNFELFLINCKIDRASLGKTGISRDISTGIWVMTTIRMIYLLHEVPVYFIVCHDVAMRGTPIL